MKVSETMHEHFIDNYLWKWVCVQHPMILISDDWSTPRAPETEPPWGANDLPGYCRRMYEMLKKVEQYPEVKVDFDLSAKEMLYYFESVPEDGKAILQRLIKSGQLGFTGTDYSQSHYGTARSESALREIRMGDEVYKRELGIVADTFQHQEVGLFQNLPQLLKAYGVKKAGTFLFPTVMEFLDKSPEILSHFAGAGGRMDFMRNNTMARWVGLDGTEIPIYLPMVYHTMNDQSSESYSVVSSHMLPEYKKYIEYNSGLNELSRYYCMEYEECKGLTHNGSIIRQVPDMANVDELYIEGRKRVGDFWLLSDAIEEEMKQVTEMPRMRYSSYYSYAEGFYGEKMFKAYRACEAKILAAETMQVLAHNAGAELDFDADSAWDKLLTAQHHDINWLDQQELRDRALSWVMDAKRDAESYIEKAAKAITVNGEKANSVTVFNTLPVARKALACLPLNSGENYAVFENGKELPSQYDEGKLIFNASSEGLGYRSYELKKIALNEAEQTEISYPYTFENDILTAVVYPDGRISSLCSKLSGERLSGFGNLLTGTIWKEDGEKVPFSNTNTAKTMKLEKGALYDKLYIEGAMEDIPYSMVIRLPHGLGTEITVDLDLEFNNHTISDCVHDEHKLNVSWGLNQETEQIWFDEPFGITEGKQARPLLVANFIGAFENGKGLVYYHEGMPKAWVENGRLYSQLASGGTTISNRYGQDWFGWTGSYYDMRLNGKHHYRYSVRVAENNDIAAIAASVNSEIAPFIAVHTENKVETRNLLTFTEPCHLPTAVEERDGKIVARAYDVSGKCRKLSFNSQLEFAQKTDAAGAPVAETVRPFEIFELRFNK